MWYYPRETFSLEATGVASVIGAGHGRLTSDDELYDPNAMAAAMQDIQLPAIATVTNLANGRQVMVRVNDRGPASPTRLIALTPRVAAILLMTGPTEVRVQIDPARSMALARQVRGRAGDLQIATAPRGAVAATTLAPLPGSAQEATRDLPTTPQVQQAPDAPTITVPLHLPERVVQTDATPGALMIAAGHFTHGNSARERMDAIIETGARTVRSESGGQISYDVEAGPYASIAAADAALGQMVRDGVTDARIVVDLR